MAEIIKVALNQQQLELLDATITRGIAGDRASLIRIALREFADRHGPARHKQAREQDDARS
jgi:Arc/MetJ-type ribon-helix-helix transcriptional regulator